MTDTRTENPNLEASVDESRASALDEEQSRKTVELDVECSGDWMPVDTMKEAALVASERGEDLSVNLNNISHLDASALQILLALDREQKNKGRSLHLANASAQLRQWFEFSGAHATFFCDSTEER